MMEMERLRTKTAGWFGGSHAVFNIFFFLYFWLNFYKKLTLSRFVFGYLVKECSVWVATLPPLEGSNMTCFKISR